MNREILFKAKRLDNGEWVEGLILKNKLATYIITEKNPHECTQYMYIEIVEYHRVDPETVCQYTGFSLAKYIKVFDASVIKIWENDIVKFIIVNQDENYKQYRGVVKFATGEWQVWKNDKTEFFETETFTLCEIFGQDDELEVIGNIFDNPELLEVQMGKELIPTEVAEQEALFEWANRNMHIEPCLKMMYHIPNDSSRHIKEVVNLKKQGVKLGVPNICLAVPTVKFHGLYIKMKSRKKSKLSEEQQEWLLSLHCENYAAMVCYGWEDAAKAIISYLNGIGKGMKLHT